MPDTALATLHFLSYILLPWCKPKRWVPPAGRANCRGGLFSSVWC